MLIGLGGLTLLTTACAAAGSVPVLGALRGLQGFAAASFPRTVLAFHGSHHLDRRWRSLVQSLLASTLVGAASTSHVLESGISLAASAMIGLFGQAASPHQAGGMALNGFVLSIGASIGLLATGLGLNFPILLVALAGLLGCCGSVPHR